jgi:hypothetical protein
MESTAEPINIARRWFIVVGLSGVLLGLGGSLTWRRLWIAGWGGQVLVLGVYGEG